MNERSAALAQMANLAMQRQKFTNEQYAQEQQRMRQSQRQGYEDQTEGGMNWLNTAGTGAMVGSAGGPWGALIGGVAGAGLGIYGAMSARRQGGPGHKKMGMGAALGSTLTHPFGRKWDGMADLPVMQAAGIAGKFGSSGEPMGDAPGGIAANDVAGWNEMDASGHALNDANAAAGYLSPAEKARIFAGRPSMSAAYSTPTQSMRPSSFRGPLQ